MNNQNTFSYYLQQPRSLSLEKMQALHEELIAEVGVDTEASELYDELIEKATKYAEYRATWQLLSREEKMDIDSSRTSCHNSLITHFNMLARFLQSQGKKASWRDELGYEEADPYNRKAIGDFACYIVFINSICSR